MMSKKRILYYQLLYLTWSTFWEIYRNIQRRIELQELTAWAKKKHIPGLIRFYHNRHLDEEVRFNRYQMRYPCLAELASWLACLYRQIMPRSRFYKSDNTAKYNKYHI